MAQTIIERVPECATGQRPSFGIHRQLSLYGHRFVHNAVAPEAMDCLGLAAILKVPH